MEGTDTVSFCIVLPVAWEIMQCIVDRLLGQDARAVSPVTTAVYVVVARTAYLHDAWTADTPKRTLGMGR